LAAGKAAPRAAQLFHAKFKIHNSKLELLPPGKERNRLDT